MANKPSTGGLLAGTLDLLILKTLIRGSMHGYAIAEFIQQASRDALRVEEGALYPALHRLELRGFLRAEWGTSDNNRRAKFYRLTALGRRELENETAEWNRVAAGGRSRDADGVSGRMWSRLIEAWYRVTASFRRRRLERDLDDEVAFHLAMRQADVAHDGESGVEPGREAARRFGNVTALKEQMRDMWTFPRSTASGRTSLRRPHAAAAARIHGGLGAGPGRRHRSEHELCSRSFNALTFHPPAGISDPSRVVALYPAVPTGEPPVFSVAEYRFLAEHATSLDAAAVSDAARSGSGSTARTEPPSAFLVSGNFFERSGSRPSAAAVFVPDEDRPDRLRGGRGARLRALGGPVRRRPGDRRDAPFSSTTCRSRLSASRRATSSAWNHAVTGQARAVPADCGASTPASRLRAHLRSATIVGRLAPEATREQARAEADVLLSQFHGSRDRRAQGHRHRHRLSVPSGPERHPGAVRARSPSR